MRCKPLVLHFGADTFLSKRKLHNIISHLFVGIFFEVFGVYWSLLPFFPVHNGTHLFLKSKNSSPKKEVVKRIWGTQGIQFTKHARKGVHCGDDVVNPDFPTWSGLNHVHWWKSVNIWPSLRILQKYQNRSDALNIKLCLWAKFIFYLFLFKIFLF